MCVCGHTVYIGDGKIMGTVVKDDTFLINMELGHPLPVIQLISFLEYIHISSEQVLIEYCTTLHGEQLPVASQPLSKTDHSVSVMFKPGHCFG